jgi:alcohol dehydrogenase
MKALYYNGSGGLEWKDDPTPVLQDPTDALVRPIAVSTCDLDQAIVNGPEPVPGSEQPFAIGHEGVGQAVEVGANVTNLRPGDIVAFAYHIACGSCDLRHRRRGNPYRWVQARVRARSHVAAGRAIGPCSGRHTPV